MADTDSASPAGLNPDQIREAIVSGDPSRALPALVGLRRLEAEQAVPLGRAGLRLATDGEFRRRSRQG